jgi:outer membrane protein assembly factor BamB
LRILPLCSRLVWGAIPLLAACAGASHTPLPVAAPSAAPTAFPTEPGAVDDWTMFAHDNARTGFEAQNTGMTPTLDAGVLFVGTHVAPGTFDALDAATGAVRWSATLPGAIHGEPLVLNGVVYVGDASGDPPIMAQCTVSAS